jgi:hypothetical protein
VCRRAPIDEADLPDWLADHIDDSVLLAVVGKGGWRYAAAFYRGCFVKACEREANQKEEISRLEADIRHLRHQLFGRKSESQNHSELVATDSEYETAQDASAGRWEEELAELENEQASSASKPGKGAKAKRERNRELAHRKEKAKVLRSLRRHWCGLTLFLDFPDIPLDNNAGERSLRGGAVGRKNYYGSGAQWSVQLTEYLFSLFATLEACGLNVRSWLSHFLDHCASLGGKVPDKEDIKEWMPWNMTETRHQEMSHPLAMPPPEWESITIETKKSASGADVILANTS